MTLSQLSPPGYLLEPCSQSLLSLCVLECMFGRLVPRSDTVCLKHLALCLLMCSMYKSSLPLHDLIITWLWFLRLAEIRHSAVE